MSKKGKIEADLKKELSKKEDKRDFGKIIQLSHDLSEVSEEDTVRFKTDAGIINRLGKELVARQETAVVELIKNSYDADATKVEIIFTNTDTPGGSLEIVDNGSGMSKEELINGFMRLSSNNKVKFPTSPKYGRTRAGKKGIGRFATQRLGGNLEIFTQPEGKKPGSHVNINWSGFTPGTELIQIENSVSEIAIPTKGTRLLISGLFERWSDADIRRVFRYVSDILQPFPIAKSKALEEVDPGFNVHLFRSDKEDLELVADEQSEILEYSLAIVEGVVDDLGVGTYSISSKMYDLDELNLRYSVEGIETIFEKLESIRFRAYYFTQPKQGDVYPKNLKKHINNILREKGGVRIYRNGFRVPPYGSRQDDWLGLKDSTAKRRILPPHANLNWIGIVELSDSEGQIFEEKSSREGLIENLAFQEMRDFLYKALTDTATLVGTAREKKITAGQKNWGTNQEPGSPASAVKEVVNELDEIFKFEKRNKGQYDSEKDRKFNQKRKETLLKQFSKIAFKLIDETAMLRVLASTGITVSEFIHEVNQTIGAIDANIHHIKIISSDIPEVEEYLEGLTSNTERFVSYISYFDQAIRENIVRELKSIELGEIVHSFVKSTTPLAKQRGVSVTCKVHGFDLYTTLMHKSEWTSIFSNLYSNSIKAIRRAGALGEIFIEVDSVDKNIVVTFSDNGDGISKNIVGDIFDPFVTISSFNKEDKYSNDQSGLGLGLKIVKDIMISYGGKIEVDKPLKNYSTTFKLTIPKAAE